MRLKTLACLVTAALLSSLPAAADLTVVSTVTPSKGKPTTSTQYVTETHVRSSDGQFDTIMDVTSGGMIHIEHKKKKYYETSLEEMQAAFGDVQKMLEDNPIMANMLGQATEVSVEKLDGTREVAGYTCQHYRLTIGQKFQFELWAAPDLEHPQQYYDARKLVHAAAGPIASRFDKLYEEMKKIDGFPLYTKTDASMIGINLSVVSEATEVRQGPIDPSVFEPPAGYKKKKSPYAKK